MPTSRRHQLLLGALALAATVVGASPAQAKMESRRIDGVCLTTGGGRFVDIPGFPGERVDRRLLPDIRYLERKYKIFITDGFSDAPIHAANGEHPIGLALDIVPNAAAGGTWRDITALAEYAEPAQDQPIAPWRWVGYDGDEGHGRGNHIHLSWNHSETQPGRPAASVYTLRCPSSKRRGSGSGNVAGTSSGDGGSQPTGDGSRDGGGRNGSPSGGVEAGDGSTASGGMGVARVAAALERQAADPVIETGGIGLP